MYLIPKAINKVMLIRYRDSSDTHGEIYHEDKCITALECIYSTVNKYFTSCGDPANVGQHILFQRASFEIHLRSHVKKLPEINL